MRRCCCGNTLDERIEFDMVESPCRCEEPGPGRRTLKQPGLPRVVNAKQYEERRRLGLPLACDIERAAGSRWV